MKNKPPRAEGLSALELLIVLGVVALILIFTWPAFQARRKVMLGEELRRAVDRGDRDETLKSLNRGAPPDAWSGATPHYCLYCKAINDGDLELLRLAVPPEATHTDKFRYHCPPLLVLAMERKDLGTVNLLLERGVSVTERYQCQTDSHSSRFVRLSALGAALEMNDAALINLMLSHASDEELRTPDHPSGPLGQDSSLFHSAVRSGNTDWIALLAKRGVPINSIDRLGDTALHEAARLGSRAMIESLLAHGADPGIRDTSGALPLDKVPARYRADLAERLGKSAVD